MKKLPAKKYLETVKYAMKNYLAKQAIYPLYASFKITHRCSLKCAFCNVWMEKTEDLSTKDVFKVLDELGNSSIVVVSLEGGDPLVRDDLGEILRYAHQKPFYLFFTTNGHLIDRRPMKEYAKHLDFIHISIDEGHGNLEFFDRLEEYKGFGVDICIQIVVTAKTLHLLEEKVRRIYDAGIRTVIMPACHLDGTANHYPPPKEFGKEIRRLRDKYRNTIVTPSGFLNNICKPHGCSTSSIIIDSDGNLFYPCRTVGKKRYNFTRGSFMDFLRAEEAKTARREMSHCNRSCGWYQYFATDIFASPWSVYSSLKPYLRSNACTCS